MKRKLFSWRLWLPGIAVFGLGLAEAQAPQAEADASAAPSVKRSPALGSPGKPQAPIDVRYELLGEVVPGQPLDLHLSFGTPSGVRELMVEVAGGEGVQVPPESARLHLERVSDDERYERTITIVPLVAEPASIDLLLAATVRGHRQSRAVSIALGTGKRAASAWENGQRKVSIDASGRTIVSLPAAR